MSFWRRLFGGGSPLGGDDLKPQRLDYLNEALALERQGDYDAALTSYRLALRDHPNDARILQNMAIAFTKTRRFDEAIRHYRRALELDSSPAGAHYGLAFLLLQSGAPAQRPGAERLRRFGGCAALLELARHRHHRRAGQHHRCHPPRVGRGWTVASADRTTLLQSPIGERPRTTRFDPGHRGDQRHREADAGLDGGPRLALRSASSRGVRVRRHRVRSTRDVRRHHLSGEWPGGHISAQGYRPDHQRRIHRARHRATPPATGPPTGLGRGDGDDAAVARDHRSGKPDIRRGVWPMKRGTLTQLFFTTVDRHAGLPAAFRSKVGGAWVSITHRDALERVQAISLGLRELGIKPGDKVAILSENRPEWSLSDYACLCARATDVPIYPTLPAKQTEYILNDSEAVAVFCSTVSQVNKVLEVKGNLSRLKHVIVFDGAAAAQRPGVLSFADLEAKGRAAVPRHPQWKQEALTAQPDDLATLIYTSGTTGDPKGVMLSHHNIWSNVQAVLQMIPIGIGDECLSMLPLSHSYERMVDYTLFQAGVIINFAESFDTVATNLGEVKPTVVLSVPRLSERCM